MRHRPLATRAATGRPCESPPTATHGARRAHEAEVSHPVVAGGAWTVQSALASGGHTRTVAHTRTAASFGQSLEGRATTLATVTGPRPLGQSRPSLNPRMPGG